MSEDSTPPTETLFGTNLHFINGQAEISYSEFCQWQQAVELLQKKIKLAEHKASNPPCLHQRTSLKPTPKGEQ